MSAETIAMYGPLVIAAVILVPAIMFLSAMLFEGRMAERWGVIRKAAVDTAPKPVESKPVESKPLKEEAHRAKRSNATGAAGFGFRRVSAAREKHE